MRTATRPWLSEQPLNIEVIMKKLVIVTSCFVLALGVVFAGEPNSSSKSNEKWLAAVEKMVTEGKTKVSTPSKDRVTLLEKWAEKNGYTAKVTKTEVGYQIHLSKNLAKQ